MAIVAIKGSKLGDIGFQWEVNEIDYNTNGIVLHTGYRFALSEKYTMMGIQVLKELHQLTANEHYTGNYEYEWDTTNYFPAPNKSSLSTVAASSGAARFI